VPGGHWQRLTVLGALACDGLAAVMTIAAATSTAVFLAFVEGVLVPALRSRPDALVVMDNLAPHKAAAVRAALDRAGLTHRYLPACSPDLNPIEPCWSKLKGILRGAASPRAPSRRSRRRSPRPSPPSRPRTPRRGSATAAIVHLEPQTALALRPPYGKVRRLLRRGCGPTTGQCPPRPA
jgi:transposase